MRMLLEEAALIFYSVALAGVETTRLNRLKRCARN
jgi:hypothetical protein